MLTSKKEKRKKERIKNVQEKLNFKKTRFKNLGKHFSFVSQQL